MKKKPSNPTDRPETGERTVLVHVDFTTLASPHAESGQERLDEFNELAQSAGADVVALVTSRRSSPDARTFLGKGKADEIRELVKGEKVDLAIFNHALSPAQERNLERHLECRVIDRTGLILDIFSQHARSFEGKLQVELAQLQHLSTRLIRGWLHLERQRGGIGLRGPGETQLEVDRRLIRSRIKLIKKRLEKVRSQRHQGRRARRRADVPTVSLVGYTNAGKSTLFNTLTTSGVYVADQLFATLDPTLRRIELPEIGPVILADTVGFIRHLPHDLIEAFRATLEETQQADLLLHVIDANDPLCDDKIDEVNEVLRQIEADQLTQCRVYNKIDLMDKTEPQIVNGSDKNPESVWVSAKTGEGMDLLREAVQTLLSSELENYHLCLPPTQAKCRAALHEEGTVLSEQSDENGNFEIKVRIKKRVYAKLLNPNISAE